MNTIRLGRSLVLWAAVCGLVHAGFSFYWAAGGTWLLDSVGQGAAATVRALPIGAAAALALIGLLKAAGAVVPALAIRGWLPAARLWRVLSGAGGVLLVLYGGTNMIVSGSVLLGWISVPGGYDAVAQWGHAVIWGPLFLMWGLLLVAGLWVLRGSQEADMALQDVGRH